MTNPRILIAAPGSGQGKTTVTCALLMALKRRGLGLAAFKCGPDFIDPMFHREILGVPSRNLDLYLAGGELTRAILAEHAGQDISVMEGVMGYYDGIGGSTPDAGSWHLARETDTPVILVLNPKGMSLTLAALVQGLCNFREPHQIAGIILNRCSESLHRLLAPMLERECGIPVVGYLPPLPEAELPSRHLGLVTAGEQADLPHKLELLAEAAEQYIDLDTVLDIAGKAPALTGRLPRIAPVCGGDTVIAVARDSAFCFYYEENLELLEQMGAKLAFFSPMVDVSIPKDAYGLYLGGGYPELYGEALSQNKEMRRAVNQAVENGMPMIAECGGFLYLHEILVGEDKLRYPMAGVISGKAYPTEKLGRFGYVELTSRCGGFLPEGESIRAHEFHYWESESPGMAFRAEKPMTGRSWECVHQTETLLAGFPHLYFHNNPKLAERFLKTAAEYGRGRKA